MATNFTWTIDSMYTLDTPEPGFVVNVLWTLTGVDGQYTASIGGNTTFNSADQQGPITPYDQLTAEIVLGWIPQTQIDSAQACVQGQLESLANPPVSPQNTPLPWNQS